MGSNQKFEVAVIGAGIAGLWTCKKLRSAGFKVALIDKSQEKVSGKVKVSLLKGTCSIVSRSSEHSLYSEKHVTFEEDFGTYDQKDAEGFIKINALRLKLLATRNLKTKK